MKSAAELYSLPPSLRKPPATTPLAPLVRRSQSAKRTAFAPPNGPTSLNALSGRTRSSGCSGETFEISFLYIAATSSSRRSNTQGKFLCTSATRRRLSSPSLSPSTDATCRETAYIPHIAKIGSSVSTLRDQWLRSPKTGASMRSAMEATVPLISTTTIESKNTPPMAAGAPKPATAGITPSWFQAKPPNRRDLAISSPAHSTGSATTIAAMRHM